jgi:hypothetical protein
MPQLSRGINCFVFAFHVQDVEAEQLLLGLGKWPIQRLGGARTGACALSRRSEACGGAELARKLLMDLKRFRSA